jgi:hypothetical protein
VLGVVVAGLLGFVILAGLDPAAAARLAAKEGPLEHASHGVLVVALCGWIVAAWRARGDAHRLERRVCIGLALACALILAEELDWGRVYGVEPVAHVLAAATGRPNLHNAWHGASYVAFAMLPLVLVGVVGWRRGDAPGRLPARRDAVGLAVLGVASLGGSLAWPVWEPMLDEVVETLLYAGLAWISLRPVASGLSTSA